MNRWGLGEGRKTKYRMYMQERGEGGKGTEAVKKGRVSKDN